MMPFIAQMVPLHQNKGAARALDKNCLLMTFPPLQIQDNFIELFLMMAYQNCTDSFSLLITGVAIALDEKCL